MKNVYLIASSFAVISLIGMNIRLDRESAGRRLFQTTSNSQPGSNLKKSDQDVIADRRIRTNDLGMNLTIGHRKPDLITEWRFGSANVDSESHDFRNVNSSDFTHGRIQAFNAQPAVLPMVAGSVQQPAGYPGDTDYDQERSQVPPEFKPHAIDVKAYGARGDGRADDTNAIQRAVNAACVGPGGEIYFPPGIYLVRQNQIPTPTTVPDLNIPVTCSGLHFDAGNNSNRGSWPQFSHAPQAVIQARPGPEPNGSPIFLLEQGGERGATQGGQQSEFENLAINGYNQAVWVLSAVNERFKNCSLSAATTGLADNTALKVTDTFWFFFTDGSLQTSSTSVPVAMFTGENYAFETSPSVGLVTFRDVITTGGRFFYDQRQSTANQPGNFIFDDVTMEQGGSGNAFLYIKCEPGSVCNMWGPLLALNDSVDDGNPGAPFLEVDGFNLIDAHLVNAQTNAGHAIQIDGPTHIYNCTIIGGMSSTRNAVTSSGKTISGCTQTNGEGGLDTVGPRHFQDNNDYNTLFTTVVGNESKFSGLPLRAAKEGDDNISIAVDPSMGLLSGPGDPIGGYDTSFARRGAQEQSLSLALADAPSSVSARLDLGGSLSVGTFAISTISNQGGLREQVFCSKGCYVLPGQSVRISGNSNPAFNKTVQVEAVQNFQLWTFITAGTPGDGKGGTIPTSYFYFVEANLTSRTCPSSTSTGPSAETVVTPTSGHQTAQLKWTPSTGTNIAGYCVWRGTRYPVSENVYFYVPGANSASFSDAGEAGTSGTPSRVNNTFPRNAQYLFGLDGEAFASSNMVGQVRLNNGKATIMFSPPWKSTPACMTNDETTAGASNAIPSAATLTILGGLSDIVDYVCFGNAK